MEENHMLLVFGVFYVQACCQLPDTIHHPSIAKGAGTRTLRLNHGHLTTPKAPEMQSLPHVPIRDQI
jgi:hypothetical protein